MRAYPPSSLTPRESLEKRETDEQFEQMNVSDETLDAYAQAYITHYREVIEQFFSNLAPYLYLYTNYPYKITVVRMGPNGVIIGYSPNAQGTVAVIRVEDFDPPLPDMNFFDICKRIEADFITFSFALRAYDDDEAKIEGTRKALEDALLLLWMSIHATAFNELCSELIEAEDIVPEPFKQEEPGEVEHGFDAIKEMLLPEPAGFRRTERWAFQFKHHRNDRVSAQVLRDLEDFLEKEKNEIDVVCLVTSGDLTTIGRAIAVNNPRIRIWDRNVLNILVNRHLSILERYFATYPVAVETLTQQLNRLKTSRLKEFSDRLRACPPGRENFSAYETIGTELWRYVFEDKLGEPKIQRQTSDGTQRRDVIFRNLRTSHFLERVFTRFDADYVIVDFKNYSAPIGSDEIEQVGLYANEAIGRFVVAVSRKGANQTAESAQQRWLRKGIVVLVLSDDHMLEMVSRKERGEEPEDIFSDILDELLIRF